MLGSEVGVHDACLRVLSQRAAGFLRVCGMAAHAGSVCFVPDLPTDFVERLGRPRHDVEAFRAHRGVRVALLHDLALGVEQVEELPACLLVVTDRRPDKPPQVVIDDYGEVAVAPFVADLVDADTDESLKGSVATQPSSRTRAMIALRLRQAIRRSSARRFRARA